MSPVSRGRKGGKSRTRGGEARVLRVVPAVESEPCDCPVCAGEEAGLEAMLADLRAAAAELVAVDDPIEPELLAATFLGAGSLGDDEFDEVFAREVVPLLAAGDDRSSLALLMAFELVGGSAAAGRAARELVAAGVAEPVWVAEAREPVTVRKLLAYRAEDIASILICSFERAGRTHGFVVQVDHTDCFAAVDVTLASGEAVDEVIAHMPEQPVTMVEERLTPEEFRWEIERALDARAVHDDEDGGPQPDDPDDDDLSYYTTATLLRARMRALPEPDRPPAGHGGESTLLDSIAQLADFAQEYENRRRKRAGQLALPPKRKRKKADGPAPIYRIKVGLRGAKPPIWRRLEVPADITLPRLHRVIQVAFGWDDSHAHLFETPYGEYGVADRELGHRAEGPVTLEQVAPAEGERFRYVYDFGDNWLHEVQVEAVLDREPSVSYPRCVGGRRAAPAEDCGGIWGYEELVAILADPAHPEHEERLEWLGLRSAAEFRPARFDAAEVTEALAALR